MKNIWTKLAACGLVLWVAAATPAMAQGIPVFDATSYAGLIREIAQGAQQIGFLEQQLQEQMQMLRSLPSSALDGFMPVVSETEGLINQIQGIQDTGTSLLSNLNQAYPSSFTGQTPLQMESAIGGMEAQNRSAIAAAMQIQDRIARDQPTISNSVASAESESAGAVGPTQAIQATNQLVGNVASQLTAQNALLTSAERAQEQVLLTRQGENEAAKQELAPAGAPMDGRSDKF